MSRCRLFTIFSSHALVILISGLLVTSVLFVSVSALEYDRATEEFERHAAVPVEAFKNRLHDSIELLDFVNILFATSEHVSRDDFKLFAQLPLEVHPYVRSIAFLRRVSNHDRQAFEIDMRRQYPGFAITELSEGKLIPARIRGHYDVVDYLEPLSQNEAAFGLDVSVRHEQHDAARRACETGEAVATGVYQLVQGEGSQLGFVIQKPVYRQRNIPDDPQARCRDTIGYTALAILMDEFVQTSLATLLMPRPASFDMSVYVGAQHDESNLAFRIGNPPAEAKHLPALYKWLVHDRPDSISETFDVAGQSWHIVVSPQRMPFWLNHGSSFLALVGGLLITLLGAAYMQAAVSRTRRVQSLVDARTLELTQANRSLLLREQAIEACINAIIITSAKGPDYPIEYVNPAFEKITGYAAAEVIGRSGCLLWKTERDQDGIAKIASMLAQKREVNVTLRTCRRDRTLFWSDIHVAPVRDTSGDINHFVVALYDVTETKRYEAQLEYQACHDALTGLANRNLLADRLQQAIGHAARHGTPVWVVFLDLDRFKFVNDSLGHHAGDLFLNVIAERLQSAVRKSDTVARFGGDEFVVVLTESENEPLTTAVVHRIMEVISTPITIEGQQLSVNCSVGISTYPADADHPDTLIGQADLAMYRAKELGRNNFHFYTETLNERTRERLKIEMALRSALERSEFLLHYQPQVDLGTGQIVGMEALLRWQHPELGMVAPGRFIDLAEETGLIVPIGEWVLRTACAQAAAWQRMGLGELRIAVNLSARQLVQPELAALVAGVLRETALPPHCLDIELTESLFMNDVEETIRILNSLRTLGVQLSIDDFGTGYSSLSYLKRFPIDTLKIDQSFVREITAESTNAAIPDAIIAMAHSLGIRVIAEGVETEAQCEFLSRNMCDEIQGYLFSKPVAAAEMASLLQEARQLPERLQRIHERTRTLLLVDDEPNIVAALKRLLRTAGYRTLTAASGQQGLEVLAENDVDVIVSDQRMPGMTGVEFLRTVKTLYPDTVRIVLSGFTELQSVTDAVNEGAIYKFLTKPWDDAQLREHVAEAFQSKEMADENRRLSLEVQSANYGLAKANRQLEELLQEKQQQIKRDEITLDIVREALQHVPLPIIGLDEEELVAFANNAAQSLFRDSGFLLGSHAEQIMPDIMLALRQVAEGEKCMTELNDVRYAAVSRTMGRGTESRGTLITLTPEEPA